MNNFYISNTFWIAFGILQGLFIAYVLGKYLVESGLNEDLDESEIKQEISINPVKTNKNPENETAYAVRFGDLANSKRFVMTVAVYEDGTTKVKDSKYTWCKDNFKKALKNNTDFENFTIPKGWYRTVKATDSVLKLDDIFDIDCLFEVETPIKRKEIF